VLYGSKACVGSFSSTEISNNSYRLVALNALVIFNSRRVASLAHTVTRPKSPHQRVLALDLVITLSIATAITWSILDGLA